MYTAQHAQPSRVPAWAVLLVVSLIIIVVGCGSAWLAVRSSSTPHPPAAAVPARSHRSPGRQPLRSSQPIPAPPVVQRYTVRPGDTLWSIAAAWCGTGNDWAALYAANRAAIGSDSSMLDTGERLVLSCRTTST